MATTSAHGRKPKLTCPSPPTGERGHHPRFHAGDEVPYTARNSSFARKLEEEAQVVPFAFHHPTTTPTTTSSQPTME